MARLGPAGLAPVLQVHPSLRCNLACAHCYSSSGPAAREELRLELLSSSLEDAARFGYGQLEVAGGEPLLYKPLPQVLARAKALGMVTTVTTNGMLATPRLWEHVAPLVDFAAISIDGSPAEHDTIRCHAGAFARTVANLEVVRASGTPFGFIFTLTQHNADSLEFVVRLAAEHGARGVQVHPLTLQGRAGTAMPDARPDGLAMAAALLEASRLGAKYGLAVHVDALTTDQIAAYRDRLVPTRPVRGLADVAPLLIVNANGAVVPLTHDVNPALRLGSLNDRPLALLARAWLARGLGNTLAAACERTWADLTEANRPDAVHWYDAVAARTHAFECREESPARTHGFGCNEESPALTTLTRSTFIPLAAQAGA